MTIQQRSLYQFPDGREIPEFTLTNSSGISMKVCTYGCTITSLLLPDRNGEFDDVILGYDRIEDYFTAKHYMGAVIGRYANRIAHGRFKLHGKEFRVSANHGDHHLHGGYEGFDKKIWQPSIREDQYGSTITLSYVSKDGEEGFPGELSIHVEYTLRNDNTLLISFHATTTKTTIVNLTQHSYFNLSGGKESILDHQLQINADYYLPVENTLIPTGKLLPVTDTPFDFKKFIEIKNAMKPSDDQLKVANGFDHCMVLNKSESNSDYAASLWDANSGRCIEIHTTEPGLQVYTANFLDGVGKNNRQYSPHDGICLETQHFPDSPNQPSFSSVQLEPNEIFKSETLLKFSIRH